MSLIAATGWSQRWRVLQFQTIVDNSTMFPSVAGCEPQIEKTLRNVYQINLTFDDHVLHIQ
jgi:hypothetical protein